MTRKRLEEMKQKLIAERERVLESYQRTTQHTLAELDDTTQDAGDLASTSHDRAVLYRLQESDAKRLKQIEDVLSRMEEDGYGICEECGDEVSDARLEAIPWATLCLNCQEEADLRRQGYNAA